MIDFKVQAEKAEKLKQDLQALPQSAEICLNAGYIKGTQLKIMSTKKAIEKMHDDIKGWEKEITDRKERVQELLLEVEAQSGYTKMPLGDYGTAFLRNVSDSYEILNEDAIPEEYVEIVTVRKALKKKITADIKLGIIKSNNWLKIKPAYKSTVIE